MKKKLLLPCLLLLGSLSAIAATLTANKTTYNTNEAITINFTGSTAAKDWIGLYTSTATPASSSPSIKWFYTNGTQSSTTIAANGSVNFTTGLATAGTYKACLLANDGYTIMASVTFTVTAPSSAAFSVSANAVKTGGSITFTDNSKNAPTTWAWTFDGGTPATSTDRNPVVTYNTPGSYNVTLTATGAGAVTATKTGYIKVADTFSATNLKVMQLNIWQEGTSVTNGMTYIRDVINAVNPDVVCFSEVRNYSGDWTTKIVNDLAAIGKTYYRGYIANTDVSLISKYPVNVNNLSLPLSSDHGSVASFEVNVNGTAVVICPSHLDYTYYATYLPRAYACGGSGIYASWNALSPFVPVTDLATISSQNLGSQRDEQIAAVVAYANTENKPILLLGDFNEPSCLDWTAKQANLFDHNGVVFEWQSTKTLKDNGFVDAYRQIYPDEVNYPGITWPAAAYGKTTTSWTPLSDERDRIDFIFYKGVGLTATSAALVGPKGTFVKNILTTNGDANDVFEASNINWPSDHRGVTSTITIPAAISTNTSVVNANKPLKVTVFPNPTKGVFSISNFPSTVNTIFVKNITGEVLIKKQISGTLHQLEIDLSSFSDGVYILTATGNGNSQSVKLVKN